MSPSLNIEPRDIVASINYYLPAPGKELKHDDLKPKTFGKPDDESRVMPIYDVRGKEDHFTLENNGFVFTNIDSKGKYEDFFDPEWVTTVYYKEVADLVKQMFVSHAPLGHYPTR